jgi:prepilin-type N-terminal cleavage/methylation domain-containing protein
VVKGGFTLIELIFAIVVIGITVISLPTMTQTTSKGIESNLVQEAIFAASTELNGAVSAYWDEHSLDDGTNSLSRVIDINNDCDANTRLLPGHISQPLHRRCLDDSTTNPLDGANDADILALEDMAHGAQDVFDGDPSASGYKAKYKSSVDVTRDDVNFHGVSDHMKKITLTITDSSDKTVTVLTTYSANVGEIDFYKKTY